MLQGLRAEAVMIFQQLFEPVTSTYTYLVACPRTREAVLIDPVVEELDTYLATLKALDLRLMHTIETHIHADHVTAAAALRERLGSRSVVHAAGGAACADVIIRDGHVLTVGDLTLTARETPGHTNACVSWVMEDRVFTGDALLIDGCGRTDFQEGDAGKLWDSIHRQLFTLDDATLVYPGHDYKGRTASTIGHERSHNARLGGDRPREDFVRLMGDLQLAKPKFIDRALPANQACGVERAAPPQG
jgi:sulfur dioxygenase